MTNISQLERDWKIYKRKERRPYILAFALLLIALVLIIVIFSSSDDTSPLKPITEKKQEVTVEANKPKENNNTMVTTSHAVQELKPSFNFMKDIKNTKTPKKQKRKAHVVPKRHHEDKEQAPSYKRTKKTSINVSSTSTNSKLESLADRFNKNRNPMLGITVAKQYLHNKQYKQAYFYALEVNNIDNTNEDSWLITAQALYHLKKRDAALKLLKTYLRKNDSAEGMKLYRSMKQGRLR